MWGWTGETPCTGIGLVWAFIFKDRTNEINTLPLRAEAFYDNPAIFWLPYRPCHPYEGAVDLGLVQDFVTWQINEGTLGLVPVGTTKPYPNPQRA